MTIAVAPTLHLTNDLQQKIVTVFCGTLEDSGFYSGKTVAEVRATLTTLLEIPSQAVAVLADGRSVSRDEEAITVVQPGSMEFVHHTGVKG